MSAFIVSQGTMRRIVAGCFSRSISEEKSGIMRMFPSFYVQNSHEQEALAKNLYAMNADAVEARYEERKEPPEFDAGQILPPNRGQFYTDLRCLAYQCFEGDIPERPLCKALEKLIVTVAKQIADDAREVRASKWDLEEVQEGGILFVR